jgi:hypothetical protein
MIAVHPAIAVSGSNAMHRSRSTTWDGAEQATTRIDTNSGIHTLRISVSQWRALRVARFFSDVGIGVTFTRWAGTVQVRPVA